jgi:MFS transporter, DHA3 family, macrolide efflux protein
MKAEPIDATIETKAAPKLGFGPFLAVWAGQLVSMLGSGLSSFGVMVWLFEKTHAATPYALAFLTSTLPFIFFAPFAGHLADRKSRKAIIIIADSGDALVTLSILILASLNRLEPWMVYLITFLSSTFQCFQEPAWASAVPTLIAKKQLGRANGLESVSQALASLLPPIVAGLLFDRIGLAGLISIDFATYFAALAGIALVKIPRVRAIETGSKASVLSDAAFGFRYLAQKKGLLGLVFYFAAANFCLNFGMVLLGPMILPISGSSGYGVAQTCFGAGALAGGLFAAVWGGPKSKKVPFVIACIGMAAVGLCMIGIRPSLALQSSGLFVMLAAIQLANSVSLFQTKIEAGAQGRTKAARNIIGMSLTPIAFLSAGPLSDYVFGPRLMAGGALASSAAGRILGTGQGRGAGLLFVLAGLLLLAATLAVSLAPGVRKLEDNLPDMI